MCFDPISAGTLLLSVASSVAGYAQKVNDADAQTRRYNENVQNTLAAGRDQHNQYILRTMQEGEATAQKVHLENLEQAEHAAAVNVNAASANVSGLSVDALLADVGMRGGMNIATLKRNYAMKAAQLQAENEAVVNQEQSRINSTAPGSPPSPLGMVGEVAGAGLKAYGDYTKRTT